MWRTEYSTVPETSYIAVRQYEYLVRCTSRLVSMPQDVQGLIMRASTTPTFDPPRPLNGPTPGPTPGPPSGRVMERSELARGYPLPLPYFVDGQGLKSRVGWSRTLVPGSSHNQDQQISTEDSTKCGQPMLVSCALEGPEIQYVGRVAPLIITRRHLVRRVGEKAQKGRTF